ncbi:polymer-forming cytoskeletal protein [Methylocystis sp. SB2]|uniref:bactofilin family protein n=1 Tax=Methylocystis sp. (strain SB2) TaxID=743836 RepID=UPI000418584F|nr:polymer-forming cytoskeletal protein [Methylocystis sp. SB2]ULO24937.1 polymer-forming cytoskeletal protein [Methylocystis sp. SB2]
MAKNAMDFRPEEENVAYIGAGVTLKGEISASDLIIVDGAIEGDVSARVIQVGQGGVIRGKVSATEADVSGWISDHIEIKQLLVVRATGRVEGKITYGEIELEKGAVIAGELTAIDDYRAAKAAPAKPAAERVEIAAAPPKPSSIDRINEAVRGAKGAKGALYLAAEGEAKRVATRTLLGRKTSAGG